MTPETTALMPPAGREPFRINTLALADWALEILADSDKRRAENKRLAVERKAEIDRWLAERERREESETCLVRSLLEEFMATNRERILGGKTLRKSRSLPHGVIGWRSSPRRLEYRDESAALAWARSRPAEEGLVRISFQMNRDAMKEIAEREKLTPPGAEWVGGNEDGEPFIKPG
jgi:phage host-nuclease inhibitor protein Gam